MKYIRPIPCEFMPDNLTSLCFGLKPDTVTQSPRKTCDPRTIDMVQ